MTLLVPFFLLCKMYSKAMMTTQSNPDTMLMAIARSESPDVDEGACSLVLLTVTGIFWSPFFSSAVVVTPVPAVGVSTMALPLPSPLLSPSPLPLASPSPAPGSSKHVLSTMSEPVVQKYPSAQVSAEGLVQLAQSSVADPA